MGVLVGVGVGVLIAVPVGVGVAVWRDSAKFQGLAVEVKTVIWTSSPLVVREETQGSGEAMSDPGQSGTSTPFLKMATEVLTPCKTQLEEAASAWSGGWQPHLSPWPANLAVVVGV